MAMHCTLAAGHTQAVDPPCLRVRWGEMLTTWKHVHGRAVGNRGKLPEGKVWCDGREKMRGSGLAGVPKGLSEKVTFKLRPE